MVLINKQIFQQKKAQALADNIEGHAEDTNLPINLAENNYRFIQCKYDKDRAIA